jgi:hypothetical protein
MEAQMGATHIWKLLHLLNVYGPQLSRATIRKAGFDCDPDTLYPLVVSGAVETLPPGSRYDNADEYRLSDVATSILQQCLVAYRHSIQRDLRIGESTVFVVMPFSADWSNNVFSTLIEPACQAAGLSCLRGDTIDRSKDLVSNILQAICEAGIVIVDASAPNLNVYYELGLCAAIGKDYRILKQAGVALPADLAGAHYIEYSLSDIVTARDALANELSAWKKMNDIDAIKAEKATRGA